MNNEFLILTIDTEEISLEMEVLNEVTNIATLISQSKLDISLYSQDFKLMADTFGCFLNKCDSNYREFLIDKLSLMQEKEIEANPSIKVRSNPTILEYSNDIEKLMKYKLEFV